MRFSTIDILKKAYGKYAVAAFNVFNAEQIYSVFHGASVAKCPVILQITPVAREYLHYEILESCIMAVEKIFPDVDYSVHLDHGDLPQCKKALESGYYNSVMIDASHYEFEENIRITSEVVKIAHSKGVSVEAELGVLSGEEGNITIDENKALHTDPKQVKEFVARTKCDSLAVAIGTSHGAFKFIGNQRLRLDILSEISHSLPGFPLVLHGASSVPVMEIVRINHAGGRLKNSAKGTQKKDLEQAIALGVCKINIATDIRLIWTRVHREFFLLHPEMFDMVIPGKEFMDNLQTFITAKCLDLKINKQNTTTNGRRKKRADI